MNFWPDELWQNERSRMWDTVAQFANVADEEIDPSQFTTASSDLKGDRGALLILFCSAGMVLLTAMGGWSLIRTLLKHRGIGFRRGGRHTV